MKTVLQMQLFLSPFRTLSLVMRLIFKGQGCQNVDCIRLAKNRFQIRTVLNTVMKFRLSKTELKNLVVIYKMITLEWYNKAGVMRLLMNVVKFPKRRTHCTVCLFFFFNRTVVCTSFTWKFRGTRGVSVVYSFATHPAWWHAQFHFCNCR